MGQNSLKLIKLGLYCGNQNIQDPHATAVMKLYEFAKLLE
jgi:hypothetical protein